MKKWIWLFVCEILVGANAAVVFRFFERPLAGLIAGTAFTTLGALATWFFYKYAKKNRVLSVSVSAVYLFGISLPLWLTRIFTPCDQKVEGVMGISLGVFHRGSEIVFLMLIVLTVIQIMAARKGEV